MDLVYLYGPPGVGKLTVGEALARLTGYRLSHNHLSIECVRPVLDPDTEAFWRVVNRIRVLVIEEAALGGVDLIITEAYSSPKDDAGVIEMCVLVEKCGGRICPVQLTCALEVLEQRVQG